MAVAWNCPPAPAPLELESPDPNAQPLLDYQFLSDPWDRERLRDAVRTTVGLFDHPAFVGITGPRVEPTDETLASDEALDRWLQETVTIAGHTACTCRMGPDDDPMAVVDQRCRVYGVQGLRVADASIMPDLVRANTNATAIMIGERAGDLIIQDQ